MKYKLSELASIAEIIGAFAVVVSLIYVGVQVNDSASAVRAASKMMLLSRLKVGINRSAQISKRVTCGGGRLRAKKRFQLRRNFNF